jgi:mannose-1-phosphate guanylyltransferase
MLVLPADHLIDQQARFAEAAQPRRRWREPASW